VPLSSKRRIFDGLTIYVNGCTKPLISDHKLKCLLAENGAKISIHLGRRQVTHVILGNPCGKPGAMGAGGGLAGTKIQKEIMRTGGCGIRYISVQW
jgi:twin BRCT domain